VAIPGWVLRQLASVGAITVNDENIIFTINVRRENNLVTARGPVSVAWLIAAIQEDGDIFSSRSTHVQSTPTRSIRLKQKRIAVGRNGRISICIRCHP
jgi:hypothetical protein